MAAYLPAKLGACWTFDLTVLSETGTMTLTVVHSELTPAGQEVTIQAAATLGDQAVTSVEKYLVGRSSLLRVEGPQGRLEPGLPILRLPFKDGDSWAWEGTASGGGSVMTASARVKVSGPVKLTTPGGAFQAVQAQAEMLYGGGGGPAVSTRYWFARGVGWVRIETDLPGGQITMVLRAYKQG